MKKTFPLGVLAYLNCAPQPEQVPIVEIPGHSVSIIDKETKRVARPLKDDPEKAAEFIVRTLEEKLAQYPKASVVNGNIYFREAYHNSHFLINYTFNVNDFCSIDNNKTPLFKKYLTLTLHEQNGTFNTEYVIRNINLESRGTPFYPMNMVSATNSGRNLPWAKMFYSPFPEARKLHKTLLLYVAHELQTIERVDDYRNSISISHPYKTISNKEVNLIRSYNFVLENIKQASPLSGNKILVQPCKP